MLLIPTVERRRWQIDFAHKVIIKILIISHWIVFLGRVHDLVATGDGVFAWRFFGYNRFSSAASCGSWWQRGGWLRAGNLLLFLLLCDILLLRKHGVGVALLLLGHHLLLAISDGFLDHFYGYIGSRSQLLHCVALQVHFGQLRVLLEACESLSVNLKLWKSVKKNSIHEKNGFFGFI